MRGYWSAYDGGGGVFDVTDSACVSDGGTCHVPLEARGEELTDEETFKNGGDIEGEFTNLPEGAQVVWGTLTVELLAREEERLLIAIDDLHLHGHRWGNKRGIQRHVDWEQGGYKDGGSRLYHTAREFEHEDWEGARARYRYTPTSAPTRLERRIANDRFNVRWFGARTASEAPGFDNQPIINWTIDEARARNLEAPGSVSEIHLPDAGEGEDGVYEYFGTIEISEGLTLRGAGGTEVVDATTTLPAPHHPLEQGTTTQVHDSLSFTVAGESITYAYRPVREKTERTMLRVQAGEAMKHVRMLKDQDDPHYLPWDEKMAMATRQTAIWLETEVMEAGVEAMVLNGNWEQNTGVFTEGWSTEPEREAWMRNSPGWAAIVANNHGGVEIPEGQRVNVRDVSVRGYGANGLLGHARGDWTVENVRLGDSLYNHVQYNASGTYTNLTMVGFAWGHAAWYGGLIENFVYESGSANDYKQDLAIFGIRGGDVAHRDEDPDRPIGTSVDGFFADLRGAGASALFEGLGPHIHLRHGVLIGSDTQRTGPIYKENGNGYQDALYEDNRIENVWTFYNYARESDASVGEQAFGAMNTTNSVYRGVHLVPTIEEATLNALINSRTSYRNHPSWEKGPRVQLFDDIDASAPKFLYGARLGSSEKSPGLDMFWRQVTLNNTSSGIVVNKSNSGRVEDFPYLDKIRLFLEDTELNMHTRYRNHEVFIAIARMRRVTDRLSGATSEDQGTLSYQAEGGEREVRVPTNLLWTPRVYEITGGASQDLVASVEVAPVDGTDKRQPELIVRFNRDLVTGEEIAVQWEAAVWPWEEGVEIPAL